MPTFRIASKTEPQAMQQSGSNASSQNATKNIQKLASKTSNSLLSQQNIPSLGAVLKELVENALDAIAERRKWVQQLQVSQHSQQSQYLPHISIHLKNHGLTSISLSDNATGIPLASLPSLTHQYHTSKLTSLQDFERLSTFGFRGVALASICRASGKFEMTTRTQDDSTGRHLSYANDSLEIQQESHVAREIGTTVIVEDLFRPFPVRRRVLEKGIKKEYQKALKLIQAYALIEHGVKFTLINETNGKRQTVFATRGASGADLTLGLRDSVSRVLGASQFKKMEELSITVGNEKTNLHQEGEGELQQETSPRTFTLTGFISMPKSNQGRSQNDRQYLYLNRRPVDLPRLSKTIQEVYKQFNAHQVPAYVLNLELDIKEVDVNVSTDKRSVFIKKEEEILDAVRELLEAKWKSTVNHFDMQPGSVQLTLLDSSQRSAQHTQSDHSDTTESQRSGAFSVASQRSSFTPQLLPLSQHESSLELDFSSRKRKRELTTSILPQGHDCCSHHDMESPSTHKRQRVTTSISDETPTELPPAPVEEDLAAMPGKSANPKHPTTSLDALLDSFDTHRHYSHNTSQNTQSELEGFILDQTQEARSRVNRSAATSVNTSPHHTQSTSQRNSPHTDTPVSISETDILSLFHRVASGPATATSHRNTPQFRTSLKNSNDEWEAELSRVVEKSHFAEMQVIGQFNKGFILAEHHGDLFILDQHASDEKYNFELLQRKTRLNVQPLIVPKQLDVSPDDIELVKQHEDIFKKNGFSFRYSPDMDKLHLKTVPQSKLLTFNEHDFHELLYTIQQCTQKQLQDEERRATMRPSKVRSMFASRACRSSVMVGTTLSRREMTKIVRQMGELDQPWHCPHGRPTMRWLCRCGVGRRSQEEQINVKQESEDND